MAKYRKKSVVIEASRWWKQGDHDAVGPLDPHRFPPGRLCEDCHGDIRAHGWVDTREWGHVVCPGDWIITGVEGEHYPIKPDIFEATYEPVDN